MWSIEFTQRSVYDLKKLDLSTRRRIVKYLEEHLTGKKNPRDFGKPLQGKLHSFWRYRVGSYRIICTINDEKLTVLMIHVAHRSSIYERFNP